MTHLPSILILLLVLIMLGQATKFTLHSPNPSSPQPQAEVPPERQHRYSCELVFFNVEDNLFYANLTQLPGNVIAVNLVAITPYEQQNIICYDETVEVVGGMAGFAMDLVGMKQGVNFETIMLFNLTYVMVEQGEPRMEFEQRKAYMIFQQNGTEYIVKLPSKTIMITQAIGLCVMLILPWNIQYRKFLPFTFNLVSCCVYICILVVAMYLQTILGCSELVYLIQKYFVGLIQLACMTLYSQDLLMIGLQRNWLAFVLGLVFSLAVLFMDFFMPVVEDAWFLNSVIAIMVAGAFIKFVIIRKIKSAVWALGLMWVFCLLREFAKQLRLQQFDQGLGVRVVPLFLQLPTFFDDEYSITCSAFGCCKMIAFGVVLNYCKRVDLYLSTHFYRTLASLITVLCVAAEFVFNLFMQELPTIEMMSILLFYPLSIGAVLFFANKRGEWAELWHGSFFDMAVNRVSIERSVSFSGLESDFGRDLMINSQASYDREK